MSSGLQSLSANPPEASSSATLPPHMSPTDENPKVVRRFAPQPIETSSKSTRNTSRKPPAASDDNSTAFAAPKPRRFSPALVETSKKSSREKSQENSSRVKFKPQLLESTTRSTRNSKSRDAQEQSVSPRTQTPDAAKAPPRKFEPILLDRAQRSRRAGDDPLRASNRDYHTESGHHIHAREHRRHHNRDKAAVTFAQGNAADAAPALPQGEIHENVSGPLDSSSVPRRPISPLDGSSGPRLAAALSSKTRTHSFRCPDLDTIESSESERESSSVCSSAGHGSPLTASDSSFVEYYKHATRIRESVDENFTHYLLQLEARKAEQRLREQALAAFPNSDFHEPVQHYVNDEEDSDGMEIEDRPVTWEVFDEDEVLTRIRRDSTNIPWEQLELQRHAENAEQERNANKITAKHTTKHSQSPWWNPMTGLSMHQADNEIRNMRDRARPPMLGNDLKFPRCASPEPARFDVTQRCSVTREQLRMATQEAAAASASQAVPQASVPRLWMAPSSVSSSSSSSTKKALPRSSRSTAKKASPTKGLWGGFCVQTGDATTGSLAPPSAPTGLMTPRIEEPGFNPFEQSFITRETATPGTPPTPPESVNGTEATSIDNVLVTDHELDQVMKREFPDSFVTQVYNYLSLGYPSLARPFDAELAKISRIPIGTLRQDDVKARQSPRGYIRLGPDFEGSAGIDSMDEDAPEESCARWRALKLYIREWARQEKNMVSGDNVAGAWGTGARRGSWAF